MRVRRHEETTALGLGMDTTGHTRTERLRLVVESAPNAIVMVDRRGTISLVNLQTELRTVRGELNRVKA